MRLNWVRFSNAQSLVGMAQVIKNYLTMVPWGSTATRMRTELNQPWGFLSGVRSEALSDGSEAAENSAWWVS